MQEGFRASAFPDVRRGKPGGWCGRREASSARDNNHPDKGDDASGTRHQGKLGPLQIHDEDGGTKFSTRLR